MCTVCVCVCVCVCLSSTLALVTNYLLVIALSGMIKRTLLIG